MLLRRMSPRGLVVLVGILLAGTLVLSIALAAVALREQPVVVVPGVRESQIRIPDEIPDAAALKFVLLYLTYFDGYTPEIIEERSNYILRFIAPEFLEKVARSLSERADYVVRTRESSVLTFPPPPLSPTASGVVRRPGGILRVTVVAERRVYIASELKMEGSVRYVLDLRPSLPGDRDTFGFLVVGLSIRPVGEVEDPAGGKGGPDEDP